MVKICASAKEVTAVTEVNMAEILIVNSIGLFLMLRLLVTRADGLENHFPWEKLFTAMIWLTITGCGAEALSFLVDGRQFPYCREVNFLLNTICYVGTSTLGYLWCLFVEYRTFNAPRRVKKMALMLLAPLLLDYVLCIVNVKTGILFTISPENVYHRGSYVAVPYLILFFYYIYSLCLSDISKKNGLHLKSLSSLAFVGPCIVGTLVQGMCYGITLGWTAVAIAFVHVYQQTQFLNFYTDSLSMLYNRRYLDRVLRQVVHNGIPNVYGIMIDVNDFKHINDDYGHAAGDRAIQYIARILVQSISSSALAIRYAGDEFILLLRVVEAASVPALVRRIEQNVEQWNQSRIESFTLSFAMGYSHFDPANMTADEFLTAMDRKMYENKHRHYLTHGRKGTRETEKAPQEPTE